MNRRAFLAGLAASLGLASTATATDIAKFLGVDIGDLGKIMGPDKADLAKVMGLDIPAAQASALCAGDYFSFTPSGTATKALTYSIFFKPTGANFNGFFETPSIGNNTLTTNTSHQPNGNILVTDAGDTADYFQKSGTETIWTTAAFVHLCVQVYTPSGPYMKVYKDGVEITTWSTNTSTMENNDNLAWLSNTLHTLGYPGTGVSGYVTEFAVIDGTIYAPSEFATGNIPKDISGLTFGTEGFWLRFQNAANLGLDSSGNGNHWTVVGTPSQSTEYPS